MSKFKDTLYLPKTDYAMRANLKELEIKILEYWQEIDLYKLQQENEKPWYELMYGPPYANGLFHMGHLLNITLKCIYEVFAIWNNYRIKCKVGFDCHGLPVELAVKKNKEFVNYLFSSYTKLSKDNVLVLLENSNKLFLCFNVPVAS